MLKCKAGSFAVSTAVVGTNQAITGVGFQPKAVIFFWGGRVTNNSEGAGTHRRGFGVGVSAASRHVVTTVSEDAVVGANSACEDSPDACIKFLNPDGTINGYMDFVSQDADGFTIVVDDQITQAHRVGYLAIGGSDVQVFRNNFAEPAATGNFAVTGVGFRPDAVLFMSEPVAGFPSAGSDSRCSIGIMSRLPAVAGGVWLGASNDAVATTVTNKYSLTSECLAHFDLDSMTIIARASPVSFDADGFTVNFLERNNTGRNYLFLALKGGRMQAVSKSLAANINDTDVLPVPFRPEGGLIFSSTTTFNTPDTPVAIDEISIGAFDRRLNQNVHSMRDEDNVATTAVRTSVFDGSIYVDESASGIADQAAVTYVGDQSVGIKKSIASGGPDDIIALILGNDHDGIFTDAWV